MELNREFMYGVPAWRVAELVRVDRATASRWKSGQSRAPWAALAILAQVLDGAPGARAGPIWAGWSFGHDGLLYAPDLKRGFDPRDLYQLHWLQQTATWRAARARTIVRQTA